MADRFDFVRGVLPQGIPTAARVLTLAFSLALLWTARGLARRKRRAWQLAVALAVATAVTHLAKGLDIEESLGSLAVFVVALAHAPRVRRAGRSGVRAAACSGRTGDRRDRHDRRTASRQHGRVLRSRRRCAPDPDRRACGARAFPLVAADHRPRSSRAGRAPARRGARAGARAATASRTSRCDTTSRGSSRRAGTRSSPTGSSPARRSSPATRSANPPSGAS